MYTRLLILALILGSLSCTSLSPMRGESLCDPKHLCVIDGTLAVESKWQISLDQAEDCYALALPETFYETYKRFDGAAVRVQGETFSQPPAEVGRHSWGYVVEGMRVNGNLCTYAILVKEIRLKDEVLWSSETTEVKELDR